MTIDEEYDTWAETSYLREWADRNRARFEPEGEVGFGRECVGIVRGHEYPAYTAYRSFDGPPYLEETHKCPEAAPPAGVDDAYHKHDCLAVLGRGPNAIHQLAVWVRHLEAQGIVIEERVRQGRPIDLIFNGPMEAILVRAERDTVGGDVNGI